MSINPFLVRLGQRGGVIENLRFSTIGYKSDFASYVLHLFQYNASVIKLTDENGNRVAVKGVAEPIICHKTLNVANVHPVGIVLKQNVKLTRLFIQADWGTTQSDSKCNRGRVVASAPPDAVDGQFLRDIAIRLVSDYSNSPKVCPNKCLWTLSAMLEDGKIVR